MAHNYIEFKVKTYTDKEFQKYANARRNEEDMYEEGNEWKQSMERPDVPLPTPIVSRWRCYNPEEIINVLECWSLEEAERNPENPNFDILEICFTNGESQYVVASLEEFDEKYNTWKFEGKNRKK